MGTKYEHHFVLFMKIVNILESMLKFFFSFKQNFFFGISAKVLVLFEDKAYYRHIFAFLEIINMMYSVFI